MVETRNEDSAMFENMDGNNRNKVSDLVRIIQRGGGQKRSGVIITATAGERGYNNKQLLNNVSDI